MEVKQECCELDMPNGLESDVRYPQKFVKANPEWGHAGGDYKQRTSASYAEVMDKTYARK